jgi:glycosyltransferase involved in cell wall biosynthesis
MTLFQSPLIHIYFESKLIDYMGAKKPILGAMDGLQPTLIHRVGAGRAVGSFDHEGLARLIREAADRPDELPALGSAGHAFISTQLSQEEILGRYADLLEALARGEASRIPAWDPFQLS